MPVIDETVTINAPHLEVFDYLVEGENLPSWDSSIIECVRADDGPLGVGARYRGASRIMGRRIEWTTEVVEFERGVRAASRSVDGPLQFTASYDVEQTPEGTRVRHVLNAETGLGGAFGRVMEPLVEKAQRKVVRENLAIVTAYLESRRAA